MTTPEILIAVAKLDGWTSIKHVEELGLVKGYPPSGYVPRTTGYYKSPTDVMYEVPDYITSRDAIIPLIEKQPDNVIATVCMHLIAASSKRSGFKLLLATPEQLCIALLKAVGEWKE